MVPEAPPSTGGDGGGGISLRVRLIGLFVLLSLGVSAVIVLAVQRFSADQVMKLAMETGLSEADAQAMFDAAVSRVVLVGAVVGVALGALAAWWLVRRVLRPLDRLTVASRAIAGGDLGARVPPPPDPELQRLADAFNQMAATLERDEGLRRRLVEDVAHELRTPLTSLRGYTEALADGVVEPTPEMLRAIHEEIERLTRLVEQLDQLARGAQRARALARTPLDLAALAAHAVELASADLGARGVRARLEDGAALPTVSGDADAIGQVFANLLQNAARYAEPKSEVVVRLAATPDGVRTEVENRGAPIPAEELPSIWERFYRVDRSRDRATGGAGIGLAIVRDIVAAHGGRVHAESAEGCTRIGFTLPASPA